ncbi:hypothetical protein GGS20DRAFT_193989 [Poronia punctata]|nr:hypothetical protein GGS20DRAFT_193989 [Poronia punctata]
MPLFSHRKSEEEVIHEPTPVQQQQPEKRGLFGSRRRSTSPSYANSTRTSTTGSSSRHSSGGYNETPSRHRSVLSRTFGHGNSNNPDMDPSIMQARERVMGAENAEREADRALAAARLRVREAREEVKRIEHEAAEEARRAKIKQYHAKEVSKRGKQLGRHGL